MERLRDFMSFIRRECAVRDQYRALEKYLEKAPAEVLTDLKLLRFKMEEYGRIMEQRGKNKFARMF